MTQHPPLLTIAVITFITWMCGCDLFLSLIVFSLLICCISTTIILLPAGSIGDDFIIDGAVVMLKRAGVVLDNNSCGRGIMVERRYSRMPSYDRYYFRLRN